MKTVTIPFDLELAKKIQNGEVDGEIVDRDGIRYEILKYDAKGDYPLIATCFDEEDNTTKANTFTSQGAYTRQETNLDLQLVVPEYLTWKEGDYLTVKYNEKTYIMIYKTYTVTEDNPINYHVLYNVSRDKLFFNEHTTKFLDITPSTPFEIAKLTDALLKGGKAWNPETKQIEDFKKESKPSHVFKPMDLCLAKFNNMELWTLVQFGYELNGSMVSVGGLTWNKWIPYEGNEHLLGTTKNPEE